MPTTTALSAGNAVSISLAAGSSLSAYGMGTMQIAPPVPVYLDAALRTLSPNEQRIGPFAAAVTVNLTAVAGGSGVSYYTIAPTDVVLPGANAPSGATLTAAQTAATQALVSGDGLGVPQYAARYESAIAQAFRLKAPASLPTIPETLPAVVAGPTYYVDPLDPAASDSNAGTSRALPWATLGKLSALTPGNGAVILLAGDASFTLAESWTTYKAHGTVGLVDISNMRGTASQPITIKPYYPRAWLYAAGYSGKPTIKWYADTVAGDWTQEAGYGGCVWSLSWTRTAFVKRETLAFFGPSQIMGNAPGHDVDTPDRLDRAYQYTATANKLYVWVPDATNPVSYYGSVRITGANAVFQTFWNGGHYLRMFGLRFEDCYPIKINYASSSGQHKGFEVAYCEFSRTICSVLNNQQTNATAEEMDTLWHDNYGENLPGGMVRFSLTFGTAGNTHSWRVYRNVVRSANLSISYGAGLLYNQSIGGTYHHAWGNYGYDCRNGAGTGGQPGGYVSNIDGSFIYNDINSNTAVVWGNIAERCGVAFQFNRAVAIHYVGNLAIDCGTMIQATASAGNESNKALTVAHNTWLWTGRIKLSDLQIGYNIGGDTLHTLNSWPVFEVSNEQAGANSQAAATAYQRLVFVNNVAINASSESMSGRQMFRYPETRIASGALLVAGNASAGLAANAITDRDSGTNRTLYLRYLALLADSAAGAAWVASAKTGVASPAVGSPLIGAGEPLDKTYMDIGGRAFRTAPAQPTIGCYEVA